MKIAIIFDDLAGIEILFEHFTKNHSEARNICGATAYETFYKKNPLTVFHFSEKKFVDYKIEDLFSKEDFDLVINLGYCYTWNTKKFPEGSLVLVLCAFNQDKKALLASSVFRNSLFFKEKKNSSVPFIYCDTVKEEHNTIMKQSNDFCDCFDDKTFAIYEMARTCRKRALCLHIIRDPEFLDVNEFLIEKRYDSLKELIGLALNIAFDQWKY